MTEVPGGYEFAARVTTGFDGGNFAVKSDLWQCRRCAALILPAGQAVHDRDHAASEAVQANLASLNEIIAEMTAKVADDPEFTAMIREVLRKHSHAVGFEFQGG